MPQFAPGESKIAVATFPVKPAGLPCTAELWLGIDSAKVARSGEVPFISTGGLQSISLPIIMPAEPGTYQVWLDTLAEGVLHGQYIGSEPVTVQAVEGSQLLTDLYVALSSAQAGMANNNPYGWVSFPSPYGLQYNYTGARDGPGWMIDEAIALGMITSSADAYFVDAVMYFSDGTTIVPYWWSCPWCPEKFRSPDALQAHIDATHWEVAAVKATIISISMDTEEEWDYTEEEDILEHEYILNTKVSWRNDSPFPITGRLSVTAVPAGDLGHQDVTVAPGGTVELVFPPAGEEMETLDYIDAYLTLVGYPQDGKHLDSYRWTHEYILHPIPGW